MSTDAYEGWREREETRKASLVLPDGYQWQGCAGPASHLDPTRFRDNSGYCNRCGQDIGLGPDRGVWPHDVMWDMRW